MTQSKGCVLLHINRRANPSIEDPSKARETVARFPHNGVGISSELVCTRKPSAMSQTPPPHFVPKPHCLPKKKHFAPTPPPAFLDQKPPQCVQKNPRFLPEKNL